MAIVGEAHIIVRAITTGVARDIQNGVRSASGDVGPASRRAGESLGSAFSRGFNAKANSIFGQISNGLQAMVPDAEAAARSFRGLVRTGYVLGPLIGALVGGISSLVGSFGALIGSAGGAAGALVAVVGAAVTLRVAIAGAGFAMEGISSAVQQATQAQNGFGKSLAQVNEELQQLKFDAEDAALAEQRAALNVEKARETLMKMQDMPADSRARRDAELSYKEAELAYRRAKDRASDLKKELKDGATSATVAGGDPYAGLTPAQKQFAQFLVGLQKTFKDLREIVARGFLPRLQDGISKTGEALDGKLEPAAERFGKALGTAVDNFFAGFLGGDGPNKLITLLDSAGPNIEKFGSILGKGFETFLDILIAAQPLTDRFITWIDKVATDFSDFIDKAAADGSLEEFFTTAGDIAADFGEILGNVFNFIGDIIGANFAEGSGGRELLDYFKEATAGLAGLGDTAEGKADLASFFSNVVENAKPLLSFLGDLTGVFLRIGENPALGDTFTKMSEGLPALETILNELIEAAPSLAELGNAIGGIFAALADSEANKIFLDILTAGFGTIRDILENEVVGGIADFIGRIFAAASAIALLVEGAFFFGKVGTGIFKMFTGTIDKIIGVIGTLQSFFLRLILSGGKFLTLVGRIGMFLTGPLGIAIGVVTTALVYFFTQTELGKKIWADFTKFLSDGWNTFTGNLTKAWDDFIKFFQNIGPTMEKAFKGIVNGLIDLWEGFVNGLIYALNSGIIKGLNSVKFEIPQWARDAAKALGLALPANVGFNVPEIAAYRIPRLEDGGVARATPGGTLALIAEAGRPERVEPLDEDGLSKRDRVLMERLGAGVGQINVYAAPDMNVTELANEVSRQLGFRMRRGV